MEKIYDPKSTESKWNNFLDENNCFAVNNDSNKASDNSFFCIMLPPPNVTGNLHMGHAFQHTMMDVLVRFNIMQGKKVLWQPGLDHAGISTQMVVEKQLAAQNVKRTDLSREEFVGKVWEWKEKYGGVIIQQMKRLGTSIDWSLAKFTLDPDFSLAVKKVFIQLYREGLIYKGKKLINWDPNLQTAISDLEVVVEEIPGNLWYIKYPLKNNNTTLNQEFITIATTRPETLLGDVAICVNPLDARYQHLIGKEVILPLVNKTIPIIGDSYVDLDFGTGCLKITPAHDPNDYAIAIRHNLPLINIFNKDLTLNKNVPKEYQGLSKLSARDKVLEDLKTKGLLLKEEACTINVPKSSNTNVIVEPLLTEQWFVNMKDLVVPAIDAVKTGEIKFVPEEWTTNYLEWLNNIQDWCISRQLWWGHQIPAWYDHKGNVYVGENVAEVKAYYSLPEELELIQDSDVLDTWFSAALWPFVTLGWQENTQKFKEFFPTNLLVTGFDIIFFWVARMIIFSLKFTGKIPFKTIYIHGIIQDQDGQKMSKTRGNVIDPIDLVDGISLDELIIKRTTGLMQPQYKKTIEQKTKQQFPKGINNFGTDALRFTFCAIATHNRHIKFELSRLEGYRNFCNKLWNAARFLLLHIEGQKFDLSSINDLSNPNHQIRELPELTWILSIWQTVISDFTEHLNNYRFDLASKDIYDFVWNEYCDWFLEFCKIRLFNVNENLETKHKIKLISIYIFDKILKVLHLIMPYITEEIWHNLQEHIILNQDQKLLNSKSSFKNINYNLTILLNQKFPVFNKKFINSNAEQTMLWVKNFITTIRNLRSTINLPNSVKLPVIFIENSLTDIEKKYLLTNQDLIKAIAKLEKIIITDDLSSKNNAVIGIINQTEIWFLMDGLIDKQAELNRLTKEINKLNNQLVIINNKLNNPQYLQNAPLEVRSKEQQKQMELKVIIDKLTANLKALG